MAQKLYSAREKKAPCWQRMATAMAAPTRVLNRPKLMLTPKRISSGQLYSEGAPGTPSGTSRRARDKLISAFSCNLGMFIFFTLFPSLAHPRNAKVGRAGLMKAAKMGG